MNARFAFIFALTFPLISHAKDVTSGRVIAFDDLPRLVKEKNENVQAARTTIKAHEERTGRLARSFLPNLSAQIGSEEFHIGSDSGERQGYWKLGANLNLYRGGRDRLENDVRKSNVRMARTDYSREYNQELRAARQAYWRLVATLKIIDDRKESLEKNEVNLRSSRRRAGAGVATAADTVQFELQNTLLIQDLKKLQLQKDFLKNQLSVALGLDDHESLVIENNFPHPDEGELRVPDLKVSEQLDVKVLNEREQTSRLKHSQNSRWWLPRVDLYSSYGLPSLSDEYTRALSREKEWAAGIRVGFDLGQGLEDQSEARANFLEAESTSKRAAYRAREVLAGDHELRHDLKLLHELIHDADQDIGKAEKFLKLTESEYSRGVKNGPDLLDAFQKFYEFRQRRTELYRDYHETKAELTSLVAREEAP